MREEKVQGIPLKISLSSLQANYVCWESLMNSRRAIGGRTIGNLNYFYCQATYVRFLLNALHSEGKGLRFQLRRVQF